MMVDVVMPVRLCGHCPFAFILEKTLWCGAAESTP